METQEKQINDVIILHFIGRLDSLASNEAEIKLNDLINKSTIRLVINLDKLEYISSSGLRVLLASLKKAKKQNGDIKLACLQPYVKEVFDISGFSTLFQIFDKEDAAINSYK